MEKQNRSWLALVAFCATTALVASLALGILFASATVAFAVGQTLRSSALQTSQSLQDQPAPPAGEISSVPAAASTTISGVITDSRCGARHPMNSGRSPAECTQACLRKRAAFVVVNGDKKYVLDGNKDEFARVAGERVRIEGVLDGSTLHVTSVTAQNSAANASPKGSLR